MTKIFAVFVVLHFSNIQALECPTKSDNKCETFWQQLLEYPGDNLKEGLKCLNYSGEISSTLPIGENNSSLHQVQLNCGEFVFYDINEEKHSGSWKVKLNTYWQDKRLQWPKECGKAIGTNKKIINAEYLTHLWNPLSFVLDAWATPKDTTSYDKTFSIDENGKIATAATFADDFSLEFDFTWYPFDIQKFQQPSLKSKLTIYEFFIRDTKTHFLVLIFE